jgi:iron complex transport system substrate-binding protein
MNICHARLVRRGRPARLVWFLLIAMVGVLGAQDFSSSLSIDEECEPLTVVTVEDSWPGSGPRRYALVPSGVSAPDQSSDPTSNSTGFDAVISVPVRRLISLSSTVIPHIRDLGMLDRLVGVDTAQYIYDDEVHRRIADGAVAEVGAAESLNMERIVAARPDLVVTSAVGADDPTLQRLESAGIPVLVLGDWREQSPLGRAEWIRLFGALFGRSDRADELFRERAERYRQLAALAAEVPEDDRPTVLANAPWQGTWPVPGGDSYVAALFADAGGRYLWADTSGSGSRFLDLEAVLQRAVEAEYWFNLNYGWQSRQDAVNLDQRLALFRAYRTERMYHYTRRVKP